MNIFKKIVFFECLLSYIFSLKITNINPKNVTLGEKETLILTVEDYDPDSYYFFSLGEYSYYSQIKIDCNLTNNTSLTCEANLELNDLDYIYNLTKTLYVNDNNTGLTVTINKPSTLKVLYFGYDEEIYSYGVSSFYFKVNYNELYNSSVSIKFGDISITKCEKSKEYNEIYCKHEFPESHNGKTLYLIINGQQTNYSITMKSPRVFSYFYALKKYSYYVSSSPQDIYFEVDSSYKINDNKIILVPETSNSNINISSCISIKEGIHHVKCSGLLNTIDFYYLYNNDHKTNFTLYVYPEPTSINEVNDIVPNSILISSSATTFTLEVDYIVNLNDTDFTLIDEYDSENKFYLKNCKKVEDSSDKITCIATITEAGYFYVYLNDVKQDVFINAYNSFLSKALKIEPNVIKFESATKSIYIEIFFDSINNINQKSITLKGNNNEADLDYDRTDSDSFSAEFDVTFPAVDTYYVYIDNVKQNVYIEVTDKNFTSKVTSIRPTLVSNSNLVTFTLTVDTNLGVDYLDISLDKNVSFPDYSFNVTCPLYCKADLSDKTKAICDTTIFYPGEHYLNVNGIVFKELNVTSKSLPSISSSPISISPSLNAQTIILYFIENDISIYMERITFIGAETLYPTCELISKYVLNCYAVFEKEDKYFIAVDGYQTTSFIYVKEKDNFKIEEDVNNDEKEKDDDDGINYLRISSLLFSLFLLFF